MKKFRDRPWYSLAVAICIGVALFVLLIRIGEPVLKYLDNYNGWMYDYLRQEIVN